MMDIAEFCYNHLTGWPDIKLNKEVDDICTKRSFIQSSSMKDTYNPSPILMKLLIKISKMYSKWLRDEPSSAISDGVSKTYITVIREIILDSKCKQFDVKDKANKEIVKIAEEMKDLVYIGEVNDIKKSLEKLKDHKN